MAQKNFSGMNFLIIIFLIFLLILFSVSIFTIFYGIAGIFPFENSWLEKIVYPLIFRVIDYDVVSIILIISLILQCMLLGLALSQYQRFVNSFSKQVIKKRKKLPTETQNELMDKIKTKVFDDPRKKEREEKFNKYVVNNCRKISSKR